MVFKRKNKSKRPPLIQAPLASQVTEGNIMEFPHFLTRILQAVVLAVCLGISMTAIAGKGAYQEWTVKIGDDVRAILNKHGIPIERDRPNPWLRASAGKDAWIGGTPSYSLYLYQAADIPLAAQMEIIQYLIKLHDSRGRRERIRFEMRTEPWTPKIYYLRPKPYYDLTLNYVE